MVFQQFYYGFCARTTSIWPCTITIAKKSAPFSLPLPATSGISYLAKTWPVSIATPMENENGLATSSAGSTSPLKDAAPAAIEEVKLPKLTASEFREYNRLAEHMDSFVGTRDPLRMQFSVPCNYLAWSLFDLGYLLTLLGESTIISVLVGMNYMRQLPERQTKTPTQQNSRHPNSSGQLPDFSIPSRCTTISKKPMFSPA